MEQAESVGREQILAWAVKTHGTDVPPEVVEELIVSVPWRDFSNREHFTLGFVQTLLEQTGARSWVLSQTSPPFPCTNDYPAPPSDEQIGAFARSTNFGYFEFMLGFTPIRVVSYRKGLVDILRVGLTPEESSKRLSRYAAFYAH